MENIIGVPVIHTQSMRHIMVKNSHGEIITRKTVPAQLEVMFPHISKHLCFKNSQNSQVILVMVVSPIKKEARYLISKNNFDQLEEAQE